MKTAALIEIVPLTELFGEHAIIDCNSHVSRAGECTDSLVVDARTLQPQTDITLQ